MSKELIDNTVKRNNKYNKVVETKARSVDYFLVSEVPKGSYNYVGIRIQDDDVIYSNDFGAWRGYLPDPLVTGSKLSNDSLSVILQVDDVIGTLRSGKSSRVKVLVVLSRVR